MATPGTPAPPTALLSRRNTDPPSAPPFFDRFGAFSQHARQRRSYPAGQRRSPLLQHTRTISHVHLMRVLRLLKLKFSLGQLELGIAKLNFNSAAFECVFFFMCPSQPTQLLASGIRRVFYLHMRCHPILGPNHPEFRRWELLEVPSREVLQMALIIPNCDEVELEASSVFFLLTIQPVIGIFSASSFIKPWMGCGAECVQMRGALEVRRLEVGGRNLCRVVNCESVFR